MSLTAAEEAQTRELLAQQAAILSLADSEAAIISNLGATDVSLSDLAAATVVDDADLLLIRQGVTDKSVSGSIIKGLASVPDASETVKGVVELATVAETQAGTDAVRAVTPASRMSDTATSASDPTHVDSSTKSASTQWVRGAMSAIATAAGFASLMAANGYVKFPSWLGGLIIQWGVSSAIASGGSTVVTFPITFPNSLWRVVSTGGSGSGLTGQLSSANNCGVGSTNSGVSIYSSGSFAAAHHWVAVGN